MSLARFSLHSMSKKQKDIKETGKNAYRFFSCEKLDAKAKIRHIINVADSKSVIC